MIRVIICAFLVLHLVAAGQSPHADSIEALVRNSPSRISNNILEDASLDVVGLATKYNYPIEEHVVTTEDGYILTMHRIPHGRDRNNVPDNNKPTIFLMHGLLSSSADWVLMGPGCGLAYILAEEGFDVWMGNARGNYYSRKHLRHNPDALLNTAFWEFSWDEIGNIDLATMIDRVLEVTGKKRIHYIGHSQGTTAFWVLASLKPEYNAKIISMHAFAPVAFMAHNQSLLLRALATFGNQIENLVGLIGIGELLPNNIVMTWAGQTVCKEEALLQDVCSNLLFLVGGWSADQHNATMMTVKFGHTPAGASVRQFVHYGQSINKGGFERYDYGRTQNRRAYGSRSPPTYDLSKITAPVFLHYADRDPLAHVNDVDRLFRELGRPVGKFRIPLSTFSHLDFLWGIDAKTLLFDRTINLIRAMDVNAFSDQV